MVLPVGLSELYRGFSCGTMGHYIGLPCPKCTRAALLHSFCFEDEHCALKWIDF